MDEDQVSEFAGSAEGEAEPAETPETEPEAEGQAAETDEIAASSADGLPEPDPEDPAEQTPEQRAGLRTALVETRKKQQKTEREAGERIARLEGQLQALQQQGKEGQKPEDPEDAFFEDPVGYVNRQKDATQEKFVKARIDISRDMMMHAHSDYEDVERDFIAAANENKALWSQMVQSPNPARFAYNYAKKARMVGDAGSLEELEKKIEARVTARLEKELKEKGALSAAAGASTSSAGAKGAGAQSPANVSLDDLSFNSILDGVGITE